MFLSPEFSEGERAFFKKKPLNTNKYRETQQPKKYFYWWAGWHNAKRYARKMNHPRFTFSFV